MIGRGTRTATTIVFCSRVRPVRLHDHGKYRWSLSGKKLTLKVVQDSCAGRRTVLTTHTLIKQ